MNEYRIKAKKMDEIMYLFTSNPRPFTFYSADRIEVVARWSGNIPYNAWYRTFDVATEELVFTTYPDTYSEVSVNVIRDRRLNRGADKDTQRRLPKRVPGSDEE